MCSVVKLNVQPEPENVQVIRFGLNNFTGHKSLMFSDGCAKVFVNCCKIF